MKTKIVTLSIASFGWIVFNSNTKPAPDNLSGNISISGAPKKNLPKIM